MLQINLIGYLGQNAKYQETETKKQLEFTVATTEKIKTANGDMVEKTTWVNCYYFVQNNKLAEYLKKGIPVFVQGKANFAITQTNTGDNVIRIYLTVANLVFLPNSKTDNTNEAK